jgi:hydrogenase/urease accessory protein HupE
MLTALVLCAAALAPHPNSHSSSRVVVEGQRIELTLRCQAQSLIECLGVDRDRNGSLDAAELEAARTTVTSYLRERYQLFADPGATTPLASSAGELTLSSTDAGGFSEQLIDAHFTFPPTALARLSIRCRVFLDCNPFHRDSASVIWNGEPPAAWLFAEGVERWDFEPNDVRRPGVFKDYVALGVEHIATGYDHIAFLLALLVASRRLRSIIGFVTAFTVAHSITLACAALGVVDVPSRLVEMAIALSIAYVAAENLVFRRPSSRWLEAFGFGLIHGLGFAGALSESLVSETLKVTALIGFNLGVELGQLAIVLSFALLVRFLPGDRKLGDELRAWFAPSWLRTAISVVVVALGLWWFAQRAGWVR